MCNHMYSTRTIYGLPVKVPCGSCVTCRRSNDLYVTSYSIDVASWIKKVLVLLCHINL